MKILYLLILTCVGICVCNAQKCKDGCSVKINKNRLCKNAGDTWNVTKRYKKLGVDQNRLYTCERRGRKYKRLYEVVDCAYDGKTYKDGETFVQQGKKCSIYKCAKRLRRVARGCKKDNLCYNVGDTWSTLGEEGKFKFSQTCIARGKRGKWSNIKAECKTDDGEWKAGGEKWEGKTCKEYRCDVTQSKTRAIAAINAIFTGCWDGSECKDIDEEWKSSDCNTWICTVNKTTASINVSKYGCKLSDSSCKNEGETWPDGCLTMVCRHNSTHSKPEIQTKKCKFEDQCIDEGKTFEEGCRTRECQFEGNMWKNAIITNRCDLGDGVCKNNGESWTDNCVIRTCVVINVTHSTQTSETQCKLDDGSCVSVGNTWKEGCATRICEKVPGSDNEVTGNLQQLECKSPNDTCIPDGGGWRDETKCADIICEIDGNQATESITKTLCKDAQSGECKTDGEDVVMATTDDNLLQCKCETGQSQSKGIECTALEE